MEDRIWYVYQNGQQMGPFDAPQIKQLYTNSMMNESAYVFKVGWKDWRAVEDCLHEIDVEPNEADQQASSEYLEQKRQSAPRATIKGRIDFHNNSNIATGVGVNISASGLFVETRDHIFGVGETIKLTVRIEGIGPFNARAKVIRYNQDNQFSLGYGLMFVEIAREAQDQIQRVVDNINRHNEEASAL